MKRIFLKREVISFELDMQNRDLLKDNSVSSYNISLNLYYDLREGKDVLLKS